MFVIPKLTPSIRTFATCVFSRRNFMPCCISRQQLLIKKFHHVGHHKRLYDVFQKLHYVTASNPIQSAGEIGSCNKDNVESKDVASETSATANSEVDATKTVSEAEVDDVESNAPTPEEVKILSGGDPQIENKIQFILMELELMRQVGSRVPDKVKMKYWKELLQLQSKGQRTKYYLYLWNVEKAQLADRRRKEEKRQKRLESYAENPLPTVEEDPYGMVYGLNRNAITLRLYDTTIASFHHHRVISEMVLGSAPLVIDFGYDDQMVFREAKNCASQLELLLTENRTHPQPFNISFCNANPSSNTITQLVKRIPTLYQDNYALNITEKSYLDLYPRERLVYLSPHAREEMTEFDHDEIYIIGAIVDKTDPRPFSVAKAKKEGLRMKKLPLDSRVDWGMGNKSLTINQLMSIMLEIRATGDWDKALRFIPRRKLVGGRSECPLRETNVGKSASFERRSSRSQPQVFKDYELVAQRRRGFVYQGVHDDEQYDRNSTDSGRQTRKSNQFKAKQQQGFGQRPTMRSIMSDMD